MSLRSSGREPRSQSAVPPVAQKQVGSSNSSSADQEEIAEAAVTDAQQTRDRDDLIERELASVRELAFSRPRSRQMLGVMNDFAFNAQIRLPAAPGHDPALEACLKLAEMPSKPIGYESPGPLTLALFRARRVN